MYLNRLQTYVAMVNFMMILYLYVTQSPMSIDWYWWIVIMCGIFPVVVVLDIKLIYPGMLKYAFDKNPGFQRLEKKIDRVMRELGIKDEK